MTDLEKFVELYKSIGIDCKVVNKAFNKDPEVTLIRLSDKGYGGDDEATYNAKFDESYNGFYTDILFDTEGKFIRQDFLE